MTINISTIGAEIKVELPYSLEQKIKNEIQNEVDQALKIDPYRTSIMLVKEIEDDWCRSEKYKIVFDLIEEKSVLIKIRKKNKRPSLLI